MSRLLLTVLLNILTVLPTEAKMLSPNDFSFKIFHKLRVEAGDRNIFISPASIFAALSILHNGASGETAAKMSEVMAHAGVKSGDLNRLYEDLLKTVKGQSAVKLHLANSLWMRQGVMFLKDFVETALKVFEAETGEITTAKAMNDWISKKTEGKIADVVKEVPVDAILFITNAIYFKGTWAKQFDKKLTKEKDFNLGDGGKQKAMFMRQSGKYRYFSGDGVRIVRLPYGGKSLAMYIFLPEKDLESFYKKLDAAKFSQWLKGMRKKEGTIELPRFKFRYENLLNKSLEGIGMGIIFTGKADFSKMVKDAKNVFVSKAIHSAFIEVNEEGTEAAAATVIQMSKGIEMMEEAPFYMVVDRPFFFTIMEEETGTILFMGSIREI